MAWKWSCKRSGKHISSEGEKNEKFPGVEKTNLGTNDSQLHTLIGKGTLPSDHKGPNQEQKKTEEVRTQEASTLDMCNFDGRKTFSGKRVAVGLREQLGINCVEFATSRVRMRGGLVTQRLAGTPATGEPRGVERGRYEQGKAVTPLSLK